MPTRRSCFTAAVKNDSDVDDGGVSGQRSFCSPRTSRRSVTATDMTVTSIFSLENRKTSLPCCFNTRETVNKPSTGSSKQSNCTSRPKWLKQEETDPSRSPLMESVIFPLFSFLSFFCCWYTADLCACRSPSHLTQLCRGFLFFSRFLLPCCECSVQLHQ